jgi:histidine ammonia-lyase
MMIQPGQLTLAQLRQLHNTRTTITLDPAALPGIRASAALVQQAAPGGAAVYGVNTGFGKLANQRIAQTDLEKLQINLLRSHAVGVGEPLSERVVRLVLLTKAASLARGYSGIREGVIDRLITFYNLGMTPVFPARGLSGHRVTWRLCRTCAFHLWAKARCFSMAKECRPYRR